MALNKLHRLKSKSLARVQLTLKGAVREHPAGTVLPLTGDLSAYLTNDAVVAVSILAPPVHTKDVASVEADSLVSSAADSARQWSATALASTSSEASDVPLSPPCEVLSQPDVLFLLASQLGLKLFLALAPVCRAWRDATGNDACAPASDWRRLCAEWSTLLPALKHPGVSWSNLLHRQAAAMVRAWQLGDEYELLLHVYGASTPSNPQGVLLHAALPLGQEALHQMRRGVPIRGAGVVLEHPLGGDQWPGDQDFEMTMLVLRKADGRLKLLGCRQIPPVQPEVVHNTMRWSFDASTFNMAGTRRNVADIELALPTTGTEEQSPNDDEVEQSFACLIQVHQLPLHDYWQIDRWRWDELCNAAAGGTGGRCRGGDHGGTAAGRRDGWRATRRVEAGGGA